MRLVKIESKRFRMPRTVLSPISRCLVSSPSGWSLGLPELSPERGIYCRGLRFIKCMLSGGHDRLRSDHTDRWNTHHGTFTTHVLQVAKSWKYGIFHPSQMLLRPCRLLPTRPNIVVARVRTSTIGNVQLSPREGIHGPKHGAQRNCKQPGSPEHVFNPLQQGTAMLPDVSKILNNFVANPDERRLMIAILSMVALFIISFIALTRYASAFLYSKATFDDWGVEVRETDAKRWHGFPSKYIHCDSCLYWYLMVWHRFCHFHLQLETLWP